MQFHLPTAEIFIPDGLPVDAGLARTTHLAIAAHQDDIEILAAAPILECFQQPERWFSGVVVSDGRGSPRSGLYANYNNEEMRQVRFKEQCKAAMIGEYAAQVLLDYPSNAIKDSANPKPVEDLVALLQLARPSYIYTHNLADKHDTHVAVALRVITAIRSLPPELRPAGLYGGEVWRNLDWLLDQDKIYLDTSEHENLQLALIGVFDSQIAGGKRYDLASMGRRRANATYAESHGVDTAEGLSYAMDLTPLILDPEHSITDYVQEFIQRFNQDVLSRLNRFA
jgi:LmbE family N-acetylglucosaminyl deacetylase